MPDSSLEFTSANYNVQEDDKRERSTKVKARGEEESLSQLEKEIQSKAGSQLFPSNTIS